jgi:hypothetical protein
MCGKNSFLISSHHTDEGQPECQRCKKAGYKCQGYERTLIFHNQTTNPTGTGTSQSLVAGRMANTRKELSPPAIMTMLTTSRPTDLEIPVARELDLSPFQDNILFACLFKNYVHGNFGTPWLNLSAEGGLGETSLEASRTLAAEFFAMYHRNPTFRTRATAHYGQSLRLLRSDLDAVGHISADTLLIPIMILISYDVRDQTVAAFEEASADMLVQFLTYSDGLSWDHHDGLAHVVQFCGPQCFQREPQKSAFDNCREIIVCVSLLFE